MAGNPLLLKLPSMTPNCAVALEELFIDSGFNNGEFQNLFIDHNQTAYAIQNPRVRAVKFVGSTEGGKKIAEICGKAMKKGTFELGGSDPFIVMDDADIELASSKAVVGRMKANG